MEEAYTMVIHLVRVLATLAQLKVSVGIQLNSRCGEHTFEQYQDSVKRSYIPAYYPLLQVSS